MTIPLNGPLHSGVPKNERGRPVKNLSSCTAESVEDGSVQRSGEGVKSVRGHSIDGNTLLGWGACLCVSASSDCVGGCGAGQSDVSSGDYVPKLPHPPRYLYRSNVSDVVQAQWLDFGEAQVCRVLRGLRTLGLRTGLVLFRRRRPLCLISIELVVER